MGPFKWQHPDDYETQQRKKREQKKRQQDEARSPLKGREAEKEKRAGRTKHEAKLALGTAGGLTEPRSDSGFGRWLRHHERHKAMLLTVPVEPKEPRAEKPRNRLAEEMAASELAETRKEQQRTGYTVSGTLNPDTSESLRKDARSHLIFRRHSYLPTIGSSSGHSQLEPGAYKATSGGLTNMARNPVTRN